MSPDFFDPTDSQAAPGQEHEQPTEETDPVTDTAGQAPPDGEADSGDENTEPTEAKPAELDIDELITWVHTVVLPLYQRSLKHATWCPAWFEHAEAVWRFEVVRLAWEEAVTAEEGSALSTWTLHHLDPHMAVLTSPSGPFGECQYTQRNGFKNSLGHASRLSLPVLDLAERHEQHEQDPESTTTGGYGG